MTSRVNETSPHAKTGILLPTTIARMSELEPGEVSAASMHSTSRSFSLPSTSIHLTPCTLSRGGDSTASTQLQRSQPARQNSSNQEDRCQVSDPQEFGNHQGTRQSPEEVDHQEATVEEGTNTKDCEGHQGSRGPKQTQSPYQEGENIHGSCLTPRSDIEKQTLNPFVHSDYAYDEEDEEGLPQLRYKDDDSEDGGYDDDAKFVEYDYGYGDLKEEGGRYVVKLKDGDWVEEKTHNEEDPKHNTCILKGKKKTHTFKKA